MNKLRQIASLAVVIGLGMALAPATAGAGTAGTTSTTSIAVPNDLANTPASVIAEAGTVKSEADRATVSAAARHYLQTVVSESTTETWEPTTPASPDGFVGPGCYNVTSTHQSYNVYGWVLTKATTEEFNYCTNGLNFTAIPVGPGVPEHA